MNIFLIGFMGSGKSSLGRKLASNLSRDFLDLDEMIEEKTGKTISEIFSEKGEVYFRSVERELLSLINPEGEYVVSLGGGAPCSDENIHLIKSGGLSIYIKESEDVLFGRLRGKKKERPLIANLNDTDLRRFISETLSDRLKYYEQADFIYEKSKTGWAFFINQITNYIR